MTKITENWFLRALVIFFIPVIIIGLVLGVIILYGVIYLMSINPNIVYGIMTLTGFGLFGYSMK